ncbi:MAG TPA: hypothetical protein VFU21_16170 [Kofleriaceae bacterium]|nr:hypothetical protein [Kofleriaceae bacterium]
MRAPALALAALAVGCGGGQTAPPRGPHHDPVNSPEAKSKCPDEWKAAKKAREELLGAMDDERRRAAAAEAVLAQARCEHALFDRWTIDAGSQRIMAAELRAARVQYLSARTLYQEAAGYHVKPSEIGAHALDAELQMAFVRKLDRLPPPVDLHDPAARAGFKGDMRALMSTFEVEAALAASRALDAAGGEEGGEVATWVRSACEILAVLDPESQAGYPICRRAGGG